MVAIYTQQHDEHEKATEDEKEVKMLRDINLESSLDAKVREEKCMEEKDLQTNGALESEVEARESPVDETNLQSHEEPIDADTQERDSEMTKDVISDSEAPGFSTEFKDTDEQTSQGMTTSLEPEKQCEQTTEATHPAEGKVSSEEVRCEFSKLLFKKENFHLFSF